MSTRTRTSSSVAVRPKAGAALPAVNLLPPEYAELEKLRKVQVVLAGVVGTALLMLALLFLASRGSIGDAQADLDAADAEGATLTAQQAQYAEVPATKARLQAAETLLDTAMAKEVRWSGHLRFLTTSVPKAMWFTEFVGTTEGGGTTGGLGTVTFTGRAKSYEAVADWLDTLEQHPGYTDAWSSDLKLLPDGTIQFTSTVTLTADALAPSSVATTPSTSTPSTSTPPTSKD